MIVWLIGLGVVIWYGSFRHPVAVNRWLWAVASSLAYILFGTLIYSCLLLLLVFPLSKAGLATAGTSIALPIVALLLKVSSIALAAFATTRLHRPLVVRYGEVNKLPRQEELSPHPPTDQRTCGRCEQEFPSHYWLRVIEDEPVCETCRREPGQEPLRHHRAS